MTIERCDIGHAAVIYHPELCNLYDCTLKAYVTVGPFVEIQRGATVGKFSKICSHTFVCADVVIGQFVFVGHGVMFTNDLYPIIAGVFQPKPTVVHDFVSIGSGAVLLPVTVGEGAIVGAGAVVVDDVPAWTIVVGNPARVVREFTDKEERKRYVTQRQHASQSLRLSETMGHGSPHTGNGFLP